MAKRATFAWFELITCSYIRNISASPIFYHWNTLPVIGRVKRLIPRSPTCTPNHQHCRNSIRNSPRVSVIIGTNFSATMIRSKNLRYSKNYPGFSSASRFALSLSFRLSRSSQGEYQIEPATFSSKNIEFPWRIYFSIFSKYQIHRYELFIHKIRFDKRKKVNCIVYSFWTCQKTYFFICWCHKKWNSDPSREFLAIFFSSLVFFPIFPWILKF